MAAPAAIHVGDTIEEDVIGARAAGIRPVLIVRERAGAAPGVSHEGAIVPPGTRREVAIGPPGVRTIGALTELL